MDSYGNVLRIIENDTTMNVGDYEFVQDQSGKVVKIKLAQGVSLVLATGEMEIDQGVSYEILLQTLSGRWLLDRINDGAITIRLFITNNEDNSSKAVDVPLNHFVTSGNVEFYYFSLNKAALNISNIGVITRELDDIATKAEAIAQKDLLAAQEGNLKLKEAQTLAEKLENLSKALQAIADDDKLTDLEKAQQLKETLEKAGFDSQHSLDTALVNATENLKELTQIQAQLEQKANDTKLEAEKAREAADKALAEENTQRQKAQQALTQAEQALNQAGNGFITITSKGKLTLVSMGDIGTAEKPIGISAGGAITLIRGKMGQIGIFQNGNLLVNEVSPGQEVNLGASGSITDIGAKNAVNGTKVQLTALNGNIGSLGKPFGLNAVELTAFASQNIYLANNRELIVNTVSAGDTVNLQANGGIFAGTASMANGANITAKNIILTAKGNIGSDKAPMVVSADTLTASGAFVMLKTLKDVIINTIIGKDINIESGGDLLGMTDVPGYHITGDNLTLKAVGDIGSPLKLWISGLIMASSMYGKVDLINYYSVPAPSVEQPVKKLIRKFKKVSKIEKEEEEEITNPVKPETEKPDTETPDTQGRFSLWLALPLLLLVLVVLVLLKRRTQYLDEN